MDADEVIPDEVERQGVAVVYNPLRECVGHLTNDIIYKRLAPGVLEELKKSTPKTPSGRHRQHLHRRLTPDLGHPKLREHMASVVTIMKLSDGYRDFKSKLDRIHGKYDETMAMDFGELDDEDIFGL